MECDGARWKKREAGPCGGGWFRVCVLVGWTHRGQCSEGTAGRRGARSIGRVICACKYGEAGGRGRNGGNCKPEEGTCALPADRSPGLVMVLVLGLAFDLDVDGHEEGTRTRVVTL